MSSFSPKQATLISDFKHGRLRRINIFEGAVRSGKTHVSLIVWALWVATQPVDVAYLMVGKTLTTLKRNCLEPLERLLGSEAFSFSTSAKEARLFGRLVYLEGAGDARSEAKIRGLTLMGAYIDEATMVPEDFFAMLLSRLSLPGAKLFSTTNPDNPHHWLKAKYIDRSNELDMLVQRYVIDDNPFLTPEYVAQLKLEYTGVFYDRYILGLWKAAEGAIYRQFADDPKRFIIDHEPEDIRFVWIGVDFGGNGSAHAFSALGTDAKFRNLYLLDEHYRKEVITPRQLEDDFCAFARAARARWTIAGVWADSAETVLIRGLNAALLREKIPLSVSNARKSPINDRIRFLCAMMAQDRFRVMSRCKRTIDALSSAVWDAGKPTEDVRLDDGTYNVDSLDAMEYTYERQMKDFIR